MMKFCDIHIRDPFVLADNEKYYLYGSRGNEVWGKCTGFDVYVSSDLEIWSEAFQVFTSPENFWSDMNFWAPEVNKYNNDIMFIQHMPNNSPYERPHLFKIIEKDNTLYIAE